VKLNHLVVRVGICHVRETLWLNHNLLLDCALVSNVLFWEKQRLYEIPNNRTAELVLGETGGSQRSLIKSSSLPWTYMLRF